MFVVIGTTTVDLFVTGLDQMPAAPEADEFTTGNFTFCDEPLQMVLGGNGGSAFSLARLGADVAISSAVGVDRLGALARAWHAEAGVDTAGLVAIDAAATSTTTVLSDGRLNRSSFHHLGATAAFSPDDLDDALLRRATGLLVSGYPLLECWRPDGVRRALQAASETGATTALDVGPAIGAPLRPGEIEALLPFTDFLLANEHELTVCTGIEERSNAAAHLLAAGARCVVVKRGAAGAEAYRTGAETEPLAVPGFAVDARFTVGAGDAFNAGLLFGTVNQGWELPRALRFGNAVAARVVQHARGVLGSPSREEAEALLDEGALPEEKATSPSSL